MEKMQLGSPASPSQNTYLPSFLMGFENNQTSNRNSFANSPTLTPDINRSTLGGTNQQRIFCGSTPGANNTSMTQQPFFQAQNPNAMPNASVSTVGPPTTALFDSMRNEKSFQTPTKKMSQQQVQGGFSSVNQQTFMNQSGFNQSRVMSPILNTDYNTSYQQNTCSINTIPDPQIPYYNNFWITVFGFPQSAVTSILSHFSQCGSILEKVCSSGNWIHLKFSSRLECDKALLYNGKIICDNLMVGVLRCTDESVIEKENTIGQRDLSFSRIRSLTQAAYKSAQEPTEVVLSPGAPKRSTGLVNKTLDLFFGW